MRGVLAAGLSVAVLLGVSACGQPPPPPAVVMTQTSAAPVVVPGPPPKAEVELVPPPPAGQPNAVWQPGHWRWVGENGVTWQWVSGQYVVAPPGLAHWVPGQWVLRQASGGWSWVEGHWA